MSNYLLYSDSTSTTGRNLLEALQEQGVNIKGGSKIPSTAPDRLIRWGCATLLGKGKGNPGKVFNTAKAIELASNKLKALEVMKAADIRVPNVYTINQVKPEDFPVLGRKVQHIAGNDIVLCLQKVDLTEAVNQCGCSYFTKYIPTAVEYRIHVFGDQVIKTSQKVLTQPELNKDPWIRNFDEGYTFHSPSQKLPSMTKMLAVAAVESLGLTFGAVDIVVGDDGKSYVLETNTAPGLQADSSISVYVEKFKAALS